MDNLYVDLDDLISNKMPNYHDKDWLSSFNEFKIFRFGNFLQRNKDEPIAEMHISLGKITYSIDWTELNMSSVDIPVALEFETGELQPTPSRESILYTPASIEILKGKIKEAQDFILGKHKESLKDTNDFEQYLDSLSRAEDEVIIGEGKDTIMYNLYDVLSNMDSIDADNLVQKSKMQYIPFRDANITIWASNIFNLWERDKAINPSTGKIDYYARANARVGVMGITLNKQ